MKFAIQLTTFCVIGATTALYYRNALQQVLAGADNNSLYTYPTDFTRDIEPKPLHSHNDYWRDVPYYTALSYGAISVEADVWLCNKTLYVGHDRSSLSRRRTFHALYIQPILETLRKQNPETPFVDDATKNGVYDTSPSQTLYLFVDVKTSGRKTWPYVLDALEPLRELGYLSHVKNDIFIKRPVTVVGTGNAPLAAIRENGSRDALFDGPLANLAKDDIDDLISPIASTSFKAQFGKVRNFDKFAKKDKNLEKLRKQIRAAHEMDIMVRYWELPAYPVETRNQIWQLLYDEGVDLLNVDDLEAAAGFWETNA